jgi:hypothetical protein
MTKGQLPPGGKLAMHCPAEHVPTDSPLDYVLTAREVQR